MPTNQYGQTEWDADPETAAELRRLGNQEKIAAAMMKQGQVPLNGQMVGQTYVGASPLQGLANLFHQYNSQQATRGAEEGYKNLAESKRITQDNELAKITEAMLGRPEQPMGPPTESGEMGIQPAAPAGGRDQVMQALIQSKLPAYRDAGLKGMITNKAALEDKLEVIREQARLGQISKEYAFQREERLRKEMQANNFAQQKSMAQFAAGLRQPRDEGAPVAVVGPDGKPVLVSRKDSIGKTPFAAKDGMKISTIDARSIDKSLEKSSGANGALQLLDQADELYGKYESNRAEPILGGLARVGAAVGLTDPDKAKDFELADQIAKDLGVIKLGLIGGSDTERELKVAIDTSPSPDKTVGTNREIIKNQRKAIEILQSEPDFKTEWVNKHGSLSAMDKSNGDTYGKAWRKFQKEKWGGDKSGGEAPKKVSTDADYASLPSGAIFIDPQGNQRRKP